MGKTNRKLTIIQEKLVLAYSVTNRLGEAATAVGMSESQAYKVAQTEAFKNELQRIREELFTQALEDLRLNVTKAIETIVRHMDAETTPPGIQLRAAQIYLENAINTHKMAELEKKYAELEMLVKENMRP